MSFHCVIVGDGPSLSYLEAVIAALGVKNDFTLVGHSEDVPEFMGTLDVIAIPSFHEAVPQSGLQALGKALREKLEQLETTRCMAASGLGLIRRDHSLETMPGRIEAIYRKHLG